VVLHSRFVRRLLFFAVAFATATSASAAPRKKAERRAALFVIAKEAEAAELVGVVRGVLRDAAVGAPQVEVLAGQALKKRLHQEPDAAIEGCGADLGCIAKLARKAKASEAIYVRVSQNNGTWEAQIVVVEAKRGKIVRRATVSLPKREEVRAKLLASFEDVFGVKGAGSLEAPGNTGDVSVDGAVIGQGPGPFQVAPGRHMVLAGGTSHDVVIEPGRKLELRGGASAAYDPPVLAPAESDAAAEAASAEEPALVGVDGSEVDLEALPLVAMPEVTATTAPGESESSSESSPVLRWGGVGAAVAGVLALGAGTYFGMQRRAMEAEADGANQVEAVELNERSAAPARNANLLWVAGGVLAAAGGVMLFVDIGL
jgi:hypothetical protein